MKQLIWLTAVIALIIGRHQTSDPLWIILLIFLVIDVPSTFAITRELLAGAPLDGQGKGPTDLIKDVGNEVIHTVVGEKIGIPKEVIESYDAVQDARKENKISLGLRIWVNNIWTLALLVMEIVGLIHWW